MAQTHHVFELCVDPIHGDDAFALAQNPSAIAGPLPLQNHSTASAIGGITGALQRAPYAFRTVTKAIQWVTTQFPTAPTGGFLPWTNTATIPQRTIRQIVIQCQPGLYGPRSSQAPANDDEFDPRSGLPWNGEVFPIRVPGHVSIQGTSALDTIFDARGYHEGVGGSADVFVFDLLSHGEGETAFHDSFIDSVSIRGARYAAGGGAAVRIMGAGGYGIRPSISNCFIYANDVGIALFDHGSPVQPAAMPRIVGNTIAWNQVGVFSGNLAPPHVGTARPIFVNNLIDPIRPSFGPPYLMGIGSGTAEPPSCFEGLSKPDLDSAFSDPGPCGAARNYNAYHDALRNAGNAWPYGVTQLRQTTPLSIPQVDLQGLLGPWGAGTRGDLFIADVFRNQGLDRAPHDLRLAPMVRPFGQSSVFLPNPLVNQGIKFPIVQHSQALASYEPGFPDDDLARFNAWDWDCEGVGNPRVAARTCGNYGHFPVDCNRLTDLGADEMGELIVSGYLDSTRSFSRPHQSVAANTSALPSCDQLYYFNVHCDVPPDYVGPQFNSRSDTAPFVCFRPGGQPEWYAQLGPFHNPFTLTAPPHALTEGQHESTSGAATQRFALTSPLFNPGWLYPHFTRPRVCDIGPHVADDIRPNPIPNDRKVDFAEYDFVIPLGWDPLLVQNDIFQANSWYNSPLNATQPAVNDNRHLYIDPANNQRLRSGTLSPPMVVFNDPLQVLFPKSYLFRNTLHPADPWQPMYSVNAKGHSAPQTVPYLSGMDWYGIRVTMELFDPDNPAWVLLGNPVNNVQTFLIVQGAVQGGGGLEEGLVLARSPSARESVRGSTEATMREIAARRRR